MQRVDLIVNGVLKVKGQRSDNAAVQKRITAAYQREGAHVVVRPTTAVVIPPAPTPPPKPVPPPASMWSGRGAFTTTNVASAAGLHANWTAIQIDPEGDHSENVPGRLAWWCARPRAEYYEDANARNIPLIVQSENAGELNLALELFDGTPLHVPHALVGKVLKGWNWQKAVAQGWDLLLEWYWTNEPNYTAPDADNYPLFRNVVFGTFPSETVPGRRVSVAESRAVWKGPFSVWDTEAMDDPDRASYNVP